MGVIKQNVDCGIIADTDNLSEYTFSVKEADSGERPRTARLPHRPPTIRSTGWYVKDGTSGERLSPFLPTDKLCMHDTRITAYAGKPYVTVQHALVVTFDSHKIRLRHIGVSQRVEGASAGAFGLDGWGTLSGPNGSLTICVTDFWQLYPKELELVGDRLSLNIWPRYGRTYTGVNPLDPGEIYKLWWCHTGRELSFTMPNDVFETNHTITLLPGWYEGGIVLPPGAEGWIRTGCCPRG